MRLTPADRHLIEQALDALALHAADAPTAVRRRYERAVNIVRDRPDGTRRIRSDAGQRRVGHQIDAIEDIV